MQGPVASRRAWTRRTRWLAGRASISLRATVRRAMAPVTCGAAIEVPFFTPVAVLLVVTAEVIGDPGARRSSDVHALEVADTWSSRPTPALAVRTLPTEMTPVTQAGKPMLSVEPSLPDAATTGMPTEVRLATADRMAPPSTLLQVAVKSPSPRLRFTAAMSKALRWL